MPNGRFNGIKWWIVRENLNFFFDIHFLVVHCQSELSEANRCSRCADKLHWLNYTQVKCNDRWINIESETRNHSCVIASTAHFSRECFFDCSKLIFFYSLFSFLSTFLFFLLIVKIFFKDFQRNLLFAFTYWPSEDLCFHFDRSLNRVLSSTNEGTINLILYFNGFVLSVFSLISAFFLFHFHFVESKTQPTKQHFDWFRIIENTIRNRWKVFSVW